MTILALLPLFLWTGLVPSEDVPPEEPIRLGLFLAADAEVAAAMTAGAEEALAALDEPLLTLVTRQSAKGWDGGARRAAALVYEDRALLVIAPPDAREAHDAALVTTKSRTPVLHLSGDARLRHSRVPWSFCLAPVDGPAPDVREATRRAVTLAAQAALAARRGSSSLLPCLKQQLTPDLAPVPSSPSARCPEDSPRSPQP